MNHEIISNKNVINNKLSFIPKIINKKEQFQAFLLVLSNNVKWKNSTTIVELGMLYFSEDSLFWRFNASLIASSSNDSRVLMVQASKLVDFERC